MKCGCGWQKTVTAEDQSDSGATRGAFLNPPLPRQRAVGERSHSPDISAESRVTVGYAGDGGGETQTGGTAAAQM